MASKALRGLTIEIGGDTTELNKSLDKVDKRTRSLSSELRDIDKALKLDPTNVELFAQILCTHSRALHMPAGKTIAPGRRPAHNVFGLSLLPQREVKCTAFVRLTVELARISLQFFNFATRQNAIRKIIIIFLRKNTHLVAFSHLYI